MPATPSRLPKELASKLMTSVKAAIDRADEVGGDVRDYVKERWDHDPRFAKLRSRFGGAAAAPQKAKPVPAPLANAVAVAAVTPPVAKSKALGNPEIKAQVYGKNSCAWTGRAMTVLEKHKVDYDFVDLEQPENEHFTLGLSTETKQQTVPYIYLRGVFVGGYNALAEIERLGQLEVAMMSKEERAAAPAHMRSVEIVARPNTDEVAPAESMDPSAAE